MRELWLAFEGGGTKTRILLADTDCAVLAREVGGTASSLYIHEGAYARKTRVLLKRVREKADRLGGRVTTAGIGGPMAMHLVMDLVREAFGEVSFVSAHELDMALALYDLSFGVTLVAGTGASAACRNEEGAANSWGGFGPQFGDEGSGHWIGREAISAAMRGERGLGPPTVLGASLCAFYGLQSIHQVLRFCDHSGHVPGPKVAACVPEVFKAAKDEDEVASSICRAAGRALGKLVVAAAKASRIRARPIPVVFTGGVFHGGALILRPLKSVLRESKLELNVFQPVLEPTVGILNVVRREHERGNIRVS
jgi:N-acetylglucosamine kinase-like BadF-type ATPase